MDLFNHYLQILLLGIIEGVTEFLPISSTGHLLLAEHLLKSTEPEIFNVVIRAGAMVAMILVYWGKMAELWGSLDRPSSRSYLLKLAVAFGLTGALGFLLTYHYHLKLPDTLTPVAWAIFIGGFVILLIEFLAKNLYPHDDVSWFEAIVIGLSQILAVIFPGISRSGVTIMTGLGMGMKRPTATEFSFLIGIPTMFVASGVELTHYHQELTSGGRQLFIDLAVGFFISVVAAFLIIKWLLQFVQSHTFNGFALYRIIFGGALLIALHAHAIPELGASEMDAPKPVPNEIALAPVTAPVPETNAAPLAPAPVTNADIAPVPPAVTVPAVTNVIDTSSDSTTTILAPPVEATNAPPISKPVPASGHGSTLMTNPTALPALPVNPNVPTR